MNDSDSEADPLVQLAEEFAGRYRRGERPSLREYTEKYPEHAERIRDLFPAMVVLEAGGTDFSKTGDYDGRSAAEPEGPPRQLGDFRILREIGRGGMGVVYEAVQESLGRHVALKVLPFHGLTRATHRERFRREAHAAARLHHTNIVPVFGVGECAGVEYYAMQFIQGLSLDQVLNELRRLRANGPLAPDLSPPTGPAAVAATVARSMVSGNFASSPDGFDPSFTAALAGGPTTLVGSGPAHLPRTIGCHSHAQSADSSVTSQWSGQSGAPYYRSVVTIGLQIALALEHAHSQGILHRDIKPANLLLDTRGTAWVTDFGLAKVEGNDDLTRPGDIIGTLQYMAPERLEGRSDASSDVYSLGLTLYELLTTQPAFEDVNRARLIERLAHEEPKPPRKLDSRIARDLETVVLKAIAKEPSRRYATAGELAGDLKRFLDDEPILARRTTSTERLARWARRNPAVATLGGVLAAVLLLATTASLIVAGRMSALADRQENSAKSERIARVAEQQARGHESELRAQAEAAQRRTAAALAEADLHRLQAEAGFAKARAAVDEYLTKVSESQLLQVAGLQPLRRDLLQSALTFYQGFVKERGGDPALRAGLASAFLRVGRIQKDLGHGDLAKASLDQATALHEALLTESPGDVDLKNGLAQCHSYSGRYDRAIAIWTSLVRPDVLGFRKELAYAYAGLAIEHGNGKRTDQQLMAYQRSLALWIELIGASPETPEYGLGLSTTLNNLGVVLETTGQPNDALAMFRRAVEQDEAAYARSPHDTRAGRSLAISTANVAIILWAMNLDRDEALTWEQKGNDLWKRLADENPSLPSIQSALFWNSRTLAFHLREAGRADEASRVMRRARAAFERMPGRTPEDLYNLACVRALCAELPPGADKDPTFEDDPEERRRFADQSVEALSKAIDAGHRDLNRIRTDNDLKSIRDRADVKALIAGLDAIIKAEEAKTTLGPGDRLKTQAAILAHRERLVATDAGNARLKGDLAATKHAVGLIQIELGKVADANRSFAEEMAIREALVADDPKAVTPRADLIMARIDLGEIAWKAGRLAEGAKSRHAGLEMLKRLARERPEDVALRRRKEGTERALGSDYARLGLWEEAARFRIIDPGAIGSNSFDAASLMRLTQTDEDYRRLTAEMLARPCPAGGETELLRSILFAGGAADPGLLVKLAEKGQVRMPWEVLWTKYNLGLAYYRAGRFAEAVETLPESTPDEWMLLVLAMAHHRLGHADQARRLFREADARFEGRLEESLVDPTLQVAPSWHVVACYQVLRREAGQLIEGAIAALQPFMHIHRGRAYAKLGLTAEAEAEFARAVAARPDDASVWLARGRAFVQIGQLDRAMADFARAEGLAANGPRPWVLQGRFLAERGRRVEADVAYARAADIAKGDVTPFLDAGWWVVGPYPKDPDLSQPCPPEVDPDPALDVAAFGGADDLRWRHVPTGDYGIVDLSAPFGTSAQSAYAMTYVFSADDRVVTFLVGGDDDVRLWVNGRLVQDDPNAYPDHRAPGMLAPVTVRLRKGRNVVLAKVSNEMLGFLFYLRPAEGSFERGMDFARLGLWGEAAAQIRPALDRSPPGDLSHQRGLALFLLLSGDEDGFRAHARRLVAMYGRSTDPSDVNTLCYAWLFSDRPAVDGERLVRLAQSYYERLGREENLLFELCVARYRAGRFEDAIRTINESPVVRDWPRSWPLLTLAHHRLGHADEARTWLAKATLWYDSEVREIGEMNAVLTARGDSWWNQAQFEILYREAMQLMEAPGWTDRNLGGLRALARERVKAFDGSTADLDLALLSRSGQPQLHLARAHILADLHRDREAEADLDQAVESKPVAPLVWKRRAVIHARMGRPGKAAEDILEARRAIPAIDQWWKPEGLGVVEEVVRLDGVFAELVRRDPLWHGYWDARLSD
jgi:serine/threonine protein kinase/Tfp pilus assembly protein PilF